MEDEKSKENASKTEENDYIETEDCNEVVSSLVLPKIPRPPNAFLLFAQDFRKKFSEQNPNETNKMISVRLGNTWRQLEKEQKEEYFARAKICESEHRLKYPEYQYNPFVARIRKRCMKDAKLKKQKQKSENNEGNKTGSKPNIQFNPSSDLHMESLIKQPSELSHLQSHLLSPSASQCKAGNISKSLNQILFFDINSHGNKNSELQHIQNQQRKEDKFFTLPCVEGKCSEFNSHQHLYIMQPVKDQTSRREPKKVETSDDKSCTKKNEKDNEIVVIPTTESKFETQSNLSLNKESLVEPTSSISSKLLASSSCQTTSMNDQKSPLLFQSDSLIMKRVSNELKIIDSKQISNPNKEEKNTHQDEIFYSLPCLDENCTDTRPHRHLYMMQPVKNEISKEESRKSETSSNQSIIDQQITSNKNFKMVSTPMNLSPMIYAERNQIISHGLASRPLSLFPHQNMMRSEWSIQSQYKYPGAPLYHSVNPQLLQYQEGSYYSPNHYHRFPYYSYWSNHSPDFSHASPLGSYSSTQGAFGSTYAESPIVHYSINPAVRPRYVNYNVLSESMNMLNYQSM